MLWAWAVGIKVTALMAAIKVNVCFMKNDSFAHKKSPLLKIAGFDHFSLVLSD
ncbi:MAG: hypothetical protein ACI8WB_003085 [Phenylobacterium sp.]